MNCAAIILAAGFSSRMGTDKSLLDLGGTSAIERVVRSYDNAGIDRIIVVTGNNHKKVHQLHLKAELVQNSRPQNGMLSSIKTGTALLDATVDVFFVQPVDISLISPETLKKLVDAMHCTSDVDVAIPLFKGQRGHPPLLRQRLASAVMQYSGESGLRGFLSNCRLMEVESGDPGSMLGMNTPQEYTALRVYAQKFPITGIEPLTP